MSWLKKLFSKKCSAQSPAAEQKILPPVPEEKPNPKWQAVYDAAASLHIFKEVNERHLREDGYRQLLEMLSAKYHCFDITNETNPQWKEAYNQLCITGAYEHWVGHDETISEEIQMRFERLTNCEEPEAWSAESEWPCEGQYQYLDESVDKGDNWNYHMMSHKAWALKKPFGLPGVWSFEYKTVHDRG